jgi:hypothetical protein
MNGKGDLLKGPAVSSNFRNIVVYKSMKAQT